MRERRDRAGITSIRSMSHNSQTKTILLRPLTTTKKKTHHLPCHPEDPAQCQTLSFLIMFQVGTGHLRPLRGLHLLRLSPVPQHMVILSTTFSCFLSCFPRRFSDGWAVAFSVHILGLFFVHLIPNLVPERFPGFFVLPYSQNTRDRRR